MYELEDIKDLLGDAFDPKATYMLETHRGSLAKQSQGWEVVGRLPDASTNEEGTMVVLAKRLGEES